MKYSITERIASFIIGLVTLGFYNGVERLTHVQMVKGECKRWRKINYNDFEKLFNNVNWDVPDNRWRKSLFTKDFMRPRGSQFHASIIEIDGIGYILSSYGLIRANILKSKKIEQLREQDILQFTQTKLN